MPIAPSYSPQSAFLKLGEGFADPVTAANFPKHILRFRNDRAAQSVGLDTLTDDEWITYFGRFHPLPDAMETPLAQRYHGHQFRSYNPDIGDGRGFLFAQLQDNHGRLMDLGTKGSGQTPYSRFGDGRLTLKGGVREILATELLEALGANTSKTFSIIETGEQLERNDEPSPTRSAVMVRLTHGNIRIGTFQRHAYFSDQERVHKLTQYCLETYFAHSLSGKREDDAIAFLSLVAEKVAENAAHLMAAGFVHGVLNTDNINITGEIFDFGPWRFLPEMDLGFTAAYFDHSGLYSFGRQADAMHWNIYQLGGALTEIAPEEELKKVLETFPKLYLTALRTALLNRIGVKPKGDKEDDEALSLINHFMINNKVAYEQFFFDWYGGQAASSHLEQSASPLIALYQEDRNTDLVACLRSYSPIKKGIRDTAYFLNGSPCTLLIDEVESLWSAIADRDDWTPLYTKIDAIRTMGAALAPLS
ncbi:UPF0061 protein [Kordiimonas sediminis]|uniref:UPF0061 protein n=1 Tax=Kordiimonas sediminis TaxID=1735581 RepID=A0A919E1Y1_9PROT|nr:YdiU family protein [Kordiimonas sediminis]GHF11399.1 UPF0061 protein [Kordiimonas sediminis]